MQRYLELEDQIGLEKLDCEVLVICCLLRCDVFYWKYGAQEQMQDVCLVVRDDQGPAEVDMDDLAWSQGTSCQ